MKGARRLVGVQYVPGQPAPRILFRAQGWRAQQVELLAERFGVPVHRDEHLAPLLHELPEGSWIPEKHFEVLAQLLAAVYHLKKKSP